LLVFFKNALIALIWLMVVFIELFLLFAGLISQGHDKGRLISIAVAVIIIPAMGYGAQLLVQKLFPSAKS